MANGVVAPEVQRPTPGVPARRANAADARTVANLFSPAIGKMIYELAARLEPTGEILKRYGVTAKKFKELLANSAFRTAVATAASEFHSVANLGERIKLKSQLMTELGLEEMWSIMGDTGHAPSARVAAFSAVKSLTGLERPEAAAPPAKFTFTINLPPAAVPSGEPPLTINGVAE